MSKSTLRKINTLVAAAALTGLVSAANAAPDDTAAAPTPAPAPAPEASSNPLVKLLTDAGIVETGYVAASYFHSTGFGDFHEFDNKHDTFQLDQAGLQLAYQPTSGFGALVNVIAGEDARIINYSESGDSSIVNVTQAFLQYVTGNLTVQAGKYVTLAGAEVINPTQNTQFSRSLLFFAEPLTHTGVRATYVINDQWNVVAGINNGWNTTSTNYGSKTGELGVGFKLGKVFAWTAQDYIGKNSAYDAELNLFDTVATWSINDALSVAASFDDGEQQQRLGAPNLKWDGFAAYVNYAINSLWRVSLRGEYLNDKGGFVTGTEQKLKEGTVTVGYDPVKAFELRLELRYDTSNLPTFEEPSNPVEEFVNHQTGVAVQGVYNF